MPLPITSLDDRRFDDLVAEARQRLQTHLPDVQQMAEGDPLFALTDLFAWMTETVIYRANLIPDRQRQAFLNLLNLPMRPAMPARGFVSIDAKANGAELPALVPAETRLAAGDVTFTSEGEIQPFPLAMEAMIKKSVSPDELAELGIPQRNLRELYGVKTRAFRPITFNLGLEPLDIAQAQDKRFYLLLYLNDKKIAPKRDQLRDKMAGQIINVGIAPYDQAPGDIAEELPARPLKWHIAWQKSESDRSATYLPLEVLQDTSRGGRETGVVRLRLPKSSSILASEFAGDPKYAGVNNTPPEPPAGVLPEQVFCWLTLSAPGEDDFQLGHLAINAVEVAAQTVVRDKVIGIGNGRVGQVASLGKTDIDAASLKLQVSEQGSYRSWSQVDHFAPFGPQDTVYMLDAASGVVRFGDGIRGKRPAAESRIRAEEFRCEGGTRGNLPAGSIKQLISVSATDYQLRHEWPTEKGVDAETVSQAEMRIPAHLNHRNRAVTLNDFKVLARDNPISPVARAETQSGLLPGYSKESIRFDVPGVVSLFVMPPAQMALASAPRPSAGLLRDIYQYLDKRKMVATELYVLSPEFIPVSISASVEVLDPSTLTETLNAVSQELLRFLWALPPGGLRGEGWPMGRTLEVNELRTAAGRVDGVLAVNHLRLFYQTSSGDWAEVSQVPLELYQLPEVMSVEVEEGEQLPGVPAITQPSSDDDDQGMPVPVIPDLC